MKLHTHTQNERETERERERERDAHCVRDKRLNENSVDDDSLFQ